MNNTPLLFEMKSTKTDKYIHLKKDSFIIILNISKFVIYRYFIVKLNDPMLESERITCLNSKISLHKSRKMVFSYLAFFFQ